MNIDIKFRAWIPDKKIMVRVCLLEMSHGNTYIKYPDGGFSREFELMQFIGYKDKNNKPIYDGDIVIADWHWDAPHVIEFPDDYGDFIEYGLCCSENHTCEDLKVIGNIWDNPELLNV